jgi:hypothetical protein
MAVEFPDIDFLEREWAIIGSNFAVNDLPTTNPL